MGSAILATAIGMSAYTTDETEGTCEPDHDVLRSCVWNHPAGVPLRPMRSYSCQNNGTVAHIRTGRQENHRTSRVMMQRTIRLCTQALTSGRPLGSMTRNNYSSDRNDSDTYPGSPAAGRAAWAYLWSSLSWSDGARRSGGRGWGNARIRF